MNKSHSISTRRVTPRIEGGMVLPTIHFSQGPQRNGWDGKMWRMEVNGRLLANFFDESLLRRFLKDSWGIEFSEPIPVESALSDE